METFSDNTAIISTDNDPIDGSEEYTKMTKSNIWEYT